MDLIDKVEFHQINALKNGFYNGEDGTRVPNEQIQTFWDNRFAHALTDTAAMNEEAKKALLTVSARLFLNGLAKPFADPMYGQNFCFCWKLMVQGNEAIGGLVSDQTMALLLGSAAFIDVYPLLKEPAYTQSFAKILLDLGTNENVGYTVGTVCKATLKSLSKFMGKRTALLFAAGGVIYRFWSSGFLESSRSFAHEVIDNLDRQTQTPGGGVS